MNLPDISNAFPIFLGQTGTGLNGGRIYIGEVGMDPQTNPKPVFWDAAGTIPAAQPLSTTGGMIWRAGSPARAFTDGPYSIRVTDRTGAQVYYLPTVQSVAQIDLINDAIVGLTLSNNVGLPDVALDIAPGSCKDKTGYIPFNLTSALTKRLNALWEQGSGNGGLDTAASAGSGSYNFFLIYNPTTLDLDGLFSTSFNNPVLPSRYTASRYIGSVVTNGAGAIMPFVNVGEKFWLKTPILDVNAPNSSGLNLRVLSVPKGCKASAMLRVACSGTGSAWLYFRDPDLGAYSTADTIAARNFRDPAGGNFYIDMIEVQTDTLGRIYTSSTSVVPDEAITIATAGWSVDRSVYR